jgi:hypothetical protein
MSDEPTELTKRQRQDAQVKKAEKLQDLLLDHWTRMAQEGTLSATDCATIARLLSSNGWTLDPSQLPQDLRSKLTSHVKFDDDLDTDTLGPKLVKEA